MAAAGRYCAAPNIAYYTQRKSTSTPRTLDDREHRLSPSLAP
eukprot:CAMPEP_0172529584 /NCGR_PEP_ID=MMETSP1067-20121228/3632_1 /TAXON_ID=265564 ORGANISM="Thalassiosira punctigera, Strain Tpunct2005C2" /NCGR_SAMPLE_ID=MMETSP1067 /ASSEMBLY_ACC=CAM_ASM_000444 /LENGTH=41 /DNA_ID= /DNA_START= /DNA_END= /DNA_ORIENTATION=